MNLEEVLKKINETKERNKDLLNKVNKEEDKENEICEISIVSEVTSILDLLL